MEKAEQTEQRSLSSEADWEERWAVCRSCGAQLQEEPGERDFSPQVCWKDLGSANKGSFSQYVSQDTQFSSGSEVGKHVFHPIPFKSEHNCSPPEEQKIVNKPQKRR